MLKPQMYEQLYIDCRTFGALGKSAGKGRRRQEATTTTRMMMEKREQRRKGTGNSSSAAAATTSPPFPPFLLIRSSKDAEKTKGRVREGENEGSESCRGHKSG